MSTVEMSGLINVSDASDCTHLCVGDDAIVKVLSELVENEQLSVRYWISDVPLTKEEAIEANAKMVMGDSSVVFRVHYSETTGYLWTDEDFVVGGHDIADELRIHHGKYALLEITIHD